MRPKDANGCSESSTEILGPIQNIEEAQSSPICISASNGFRVRDVSEINDDKEIDIAQPTMKRRHSLQDPDKIINSKKSKSTEEHSNDKESVDFGGIEGELQECDEKNEEIHIPPDLDSAEENVEDIPDNSASNQNGLGDVETKSSSLDDPCSSCTGVLVQIKSEQTDTENCNADTSVSTSHTLDIKPSSNVKKEEATSTSRESCKFGIRCYRRNPMHRIEEAHPGDHDYKRPIYPLPPLGTPDCPFGIACYRRNPAHFQQFSHPPETDFEQNWTNFRLRHRRQKIQNNLNSNNNDGSDLSSDLDDYEEDPFINDDDLDEDYAPSDNEDEDEEYDECDKAEE